MATRAGPTPRAVWRGTKRIKVFWFFFSKKNKHFFLKKEAKTFYPFGLDGAAAFSDNGLWQGRG